MAARSDRKYLDGGWMGPYLGHGSAPPPPRVWQRVRPPSGMKGKGTLAAQLLPIRRDGG
jgi:hypothetical protein